MTLLSIWVKSRRMLSLFISIAGMLLSVTGCQSTLTGSGSTRECKYTLKKRNSYISCIPEKSFFPLLCHLPVKVTERSIRQMFSSIERSLGTPYRLGGTTPEGFDCSGFVSYIYKQNFRLLLPRTAEEQASLGNVVQRKELKVGDLVFFSTERGKIDHVGLFIGKNSFAHAATGGIMINSLTENYYDHHYCFATRLVMVQ
ncbi:MAG: C40 family peptidase [Chlorobiaceae bacterium]